MLMDCRRLDRLDRPRRDVVDRPIPYHGPFVVFERIPDGALPSCSSEYFIDSFALAGRVPHSFSSGRVVRFRHGQTDGVAFHPFNLV